MELGRDTVNNFINDEDRAQWTPEQREYHQQLETAQANADALQDSITQREWLLIRRALDSTRVEVVTDPGLRLVALSWVADSRAHGGANWDTYLDMSDRELLARHGFPTSQPPTD